MQIRARFISLNRFRPPAAVLELLALVLLWLLVLALAGSADGRDLFGGLQAWLDPALRQPGIEHERLAGTLLPVEIGLQRYGHLPTWNPYLNGGQPIFNDPFSCLFNPVYSVPLLLFGGVTGSKLAAALALLVAAVSMWALARAVGVGGLARVMAGALYMGSGGIAAKFYTGHFQLGLSLAWLPLVFAALWWTLTSRDRRAPVVLAVAFALLYTSGNIYYTLHALVCCAVIFAAFLFERTAGRWSVHWWRLRRVLIAAAFAIGLSALALLPVLTTAPYILHDGDPALLNRYSLPQAALNLALPWEQWQPQFDELPPLNLYAAVDYNSIGPAPFLLIAAAALFSLRRARFPRRVTLIALLLALLLMIWGAGQTTLLQTLYATIDLLAQFRYVGRALAVAALWWILLAALALETLLRVLGGWRWRGLPIGRLTVMLAALVTVGHLLLLNRPLLPLRPPLGSFAPLYEAAREADPDTPFPMIQEPHVPMAFDPYYAEIRNWGLTEGWLPGALPGILPPEVGRLPDLPRWAIVSNIYGGASRLYAENFVRSHDYQPRGCFLLQPQPDADPCAVAADSPYVAVLYEQPDALPYAFIAPTAALMAAPAALTRSTVLPAAVLSHQQDTITIQAAVPPDAAYYLVVQETHFPGWQVDADGQPIASVTLAPSDEGITPRGFIGIPLLAGQHTYTLRFQPPGLAAALLIFFMTLALIAFYLLRPNAKSQTERSAGSSIKD